MPARPKRTPKPEPKRIVERVIHAFKAGDLRSSTGTPVKARKQAIAIALSESGQSRPGGTRQKRQKTNRNKTA